MAFGLGTLMGPVAAVRATVPVLERNDIERIVALVAAQARSDVCLRVSALAEQNGFQEIESKDIPGQFVQRVVPPRGAPSGISGAQSLQSTAIRQMEVLARLGYFVATDTAIERGFVRTKHTAREYRLTPRGWALGWPCVRAGRSSLLSIEGADFVKLHDDGAAEFSIRARIGLPAPPTWAMTEEVRELFPQLAQELKGRQHKVPAFRRADGTLAVFDRSTTLGELEATLRKRRLFPVEDVAVPERAVLEAALEALRVSPPPVSTPLTGRLTGFPDLCWRPLPEYSSADPRAAVEQQGSEESIWSVPRRGGMEEPTWRLRAHRLQRNAAARVLSEVPLSVAFRGDIAAALTRGNGCASLGDFDTEVLGALPILGNRPMRVFARLRSKKPPAWAVALARTGDFPDLARLLEEGLYFEVATNPTPDGGWISRTSTVFEPRFVLPVLSAVGISNSWTPIAGSDRRQFVSIEGADIHVVAARQGTHEEGKRSGPGTVEVDVRASARPVVLVCFGGGPIEWKFSVRSSARIVAVLIIGADWQGVSGIPANVPVTVAGGNPLGNFDPRWTLRGTVAPVDTALVEGSGETIVELGDHVTSRDSQVVDRGSGRHLVIPQGVSIDRGGDGQFRIHSSDSVPSDAIVSLATVNAVHRLVGAYPQTYNFGFSMQSATVDGREGLRMQRSSKHLP